MGKMKKLVVLLLALCMVLSFAPVYAEGEYAVKGISDGDRFAISLQDTNPTQSIYIVDAGATGLKPTSASGLSSADFYIDGALAGSASSAPFVFELPLEKGDHTLKVTANPSEGASFDIGTYTYTVLVTADTNDSVKEDFDEGTEGEAVSFGNMTIADSESVTYEVAPGTGSMAMTFSSEVESGASNVFLKNIAVPDSKLMTFEYDFYSANSSGNTITNQMRNNGGSAVVSGYTFGALNSGKYNKNEWNHVSYVFDFDSLTFRGYLNGYEIERGTLNNSANAHVRFYFNRYSLGILYIDNVKFSGKVDVGNITATDYKVMGIADGERIPVGAKASSLKRTISIVDASASGKTVSAATNLQKADFYIDGVLAGSCEAVPCQWDLPMTDLSQHTLSVTTTDIGGNTQDLGPFTYTAVRMKDEARSHAQYFDGTAGESLTLNELPGMNANSSSTENPQYAEIAGGKGTVLKLTGESGKSSNYQTSQNIYVAPDGITTMDVDFYCTKKSSNHKLYFRSRNGGGFNIKNGNMTLIDGLSMGDLDANTWHHLSMIFDIHTLKYVFILDGYEIERGDVASNIADRTIYFQIATQNYGSCEWYFDNIEILSKYATDDEIAAISDDGDSASAVVISGSDAKAFKAYRAEFNENGKLMSVSVESADLLADSIWQSSFSLTPAVGAGVGIFLWDTNTLEPLTDVLKK